MIRRAQAGDLNALAALERRAQEIPWTRGQLEKLARHGDRIWVLELEDGLYGWIGCRVAGTEADILNVVVDPRCRRAGYGRDLLAAVLEDCRALQVTYLFLEVRSSNVAAQRLYAQAGFVVCGTRPGYYAVSAAKVGAAIATTQGREDALVMRCDLLPVDDLGSGSGTL